MGEASDRAEVNARIVYWGVEGAGKESNLRSIHGKLRPDHRGRLEAVPTALDPSVCSWRLPIELGEIAGVRTRIQVIAVPGGPEQTPTRKQLLDRVDGVVFVVDARRERIDENVAAFEELRSALAAYGRSLESVPLVVQYNYHDQSDPYVLEELHRKLDVKGAAAFEANASDGTGVLPTLTTISKRVVRQLRESEHAAAQSAQSPVTQPVSLGATLLRAPRGVEHASEGAKGAVARSLQGAEGAAQRAEGERSTSGPKSAEPSEVHKARLTLGNQPRSTEGRSLRQPPNPTPAPANLRSTAVVLESLDLEEAALSADVDMLDERDDAISRAQDLLDPSWSDLGSDLDAPIEAAVPLGPAALPGGWHLVSAERPTVVGAATLQIPLRIADDAGHELGFRLTVSLEPSLDE